MVHKKEVKRLDAKLRRARRINIRRSKRQNNLSSTICSQSNVSKIRKGPGRPKSNIGSASRAMNYVQIVSQFSESNQGGLKRNRSHEIRTVEHDEIRSLDHRSKNGDGSCYVEKALETQMQSQLYALDESQTNDQPPKHLSSIIHNESNVSETRNELDSPISNISSTSRAMDFVQIVSQFSEFNQGVLKQKHSHEIETVEHHDIRSLDHRVKNVYGSCSIEKALSAPMQFQTYAFDESQTNSQPQKNLVGNFGCHDYMSKMAMQDSVSEPVPQVFVPRNDNDFESEDETDSDNNLWEISESSSNYDSTSEDDDEHVQFIQRHNSESSNLSSYVDLGDPLHECSYCGACLWYNERIAKNKHSQNPKFSLCCRKGKVQLPTLSEPPEFLRHLLFDFETLESKNFLSQIRMYNMMFAFTLPGAKFDSNLNNGKGPPTVRIQGQFCHRIGNLLPKGGEAPKFGQLYIYDTENEIKNRIQGVRNNRNIDSTIVENLSKMLYENNTHAKSFKMARERLNSGIHVPDLKLRLISDRKTDGRVYNLPTVSEVAALIVGDVGDAEERDIIIQAQGGQLHEFHASYLSY